MRIQNSIRNSTYALAGQFCSTLFSFIGRTVFIKVLGTMYLGVSGLFSNVLLVLSFAELGIGDAIVYNLYKPLAENNKERLKSLMLFYKKAYTVVGFIVLTIGLSLIPFLNFIIKEKTTVDNLKLIYVLYLLNSVCTYFFAYKRTLIITDQKSYIDTLNKNKFFIAQTIGQIICLLIFKNFVAYLVIQILFNFLTNISITVKANKMYPFLKEKNITKLDKKELKEIFKQTYALIMHKIGGIVVEGTDNIVISTFLGVYWVGIYANYLMIINVIKLLLAQVFNSLNASIGNLVASTNSDKSKEVFGKLILINFWLYGFSSVCLWVLLNPFIYIWLGDKYILNKYIVAVIVLNCYVAGMRKVVSSYKETSGLFWNDRFRPLAEIFINLVLSIILIKRIGLAGVFLGTLISSLTTTVWLEAFIVYKHVFKKNVLKYYLRYSLYFIIIFITAQIVDFACSYVTVESYFGFAIKLILCVLITNAILLCVFGWTDNFKQIINIIITFLKSKMKANIRTGDNSIV